LISKCQGEERKSRVGGVLLKFIVETRALKRRKVASLMELEQKQSRGVKNYELLGGESLAQKRRKKRRDNSLARYRHVEA